MLNRADFEMSTSSSSLIFRSRASARSFREIFLAMAESSRLPFLYLWRLSLRTVASATENLASKRLLFANYAELARDYFAAAGRARLSAVAVQVTNAVKYRLSILLYRTYKSKRLLLSEGSRVMKVGLF